MNERAKVLSIRLAKTLNLFNTSLTTCLCNAREHVAKSEEIKQRATKTQQVRFKGTILTSNKTQLKKILSQTSTTASCSSATAVSEQQGSKI